jgi:hypothetical protein
MNIPLEALKKMRMWCLHTVNSWVVETPEVGFSRESYVVGFSGRV